MQNFSPFDRTPSMANSADNAAAEAEPPPTWRERLFRPQWLAILAVLVAVPVFGPWALQQVPELEQHADYQLPFAQVKLEPAPGEALPTDFLEQVRLRGRFDEQLSLLDDELPRRLAEAFAGHPWVSRVQAVRNIYPATVTIELEYRRPAALIEVSGGFYVVDPQGVLLPPADFDEQALQRYLPVRGIVSRPSGAAGRIWNDPAVLGSAKLADFLGSRWQSLGLEAIELAEAVPRDALPDDIRYELRTTGGSRILWGRLPGSTHPGELAARQKLGRLEKYLSEFGSFDQPHGPYEIDIRHWQEISRRPLTHPHANTARGQPRGESR